MKNIVSYSSPANPLMAAQASLHKNSAQLDRMIAKFQREIESALCGHFGPEYVAVEVAAYTGRLLQVLKRRLLAAQERSTRMEAECRIK